MNKKGLSIKCFCNLNSNEFNKFTHKIFDYKKPPRGEINIDFKRKYYRKYLKCDLCGHFFGQHQHQITIRPLLQLPGDQNLQTYTLSTHLCSSFFQVMQ